MSYVGNTPFTAAFLTDTFSGNGSTVAFTMSVAPATTSSVIVAITGVLQDPSTYSVSGTTLTFSAAPPTGTSNISVRYLGIPASGVTTTAYRTQTEFTATAGQTTFSVPSYTVGFIDVYRNGLLLGSSDFTATNGTTVVLTNAASAGDFVETVSFYVSSVLNALPTTGGTLSGQLTINSATGQKPLIAQVNGTEVFEVDASGNVGIGTASPDLYAGRSTMSINGSTGGIITLQANGTQKLRLFTGASSNVGTLTGALDISTGDASALTFATNSAERMRIDSSGNVGIGTSSPAYKLDVSGVISSNDTVRVSGGTTVNVLSTAGGGEGVVGTSSNHALQFRTNNTERARIDTSGNLLVGTTGQIGTEKIGVEQTSTTGQAVYCYVANASYAGNAIVVNTARAANTAFTSIATYSAGVNQFYVGGTGLIYSVQLAGGATTLSVNASGQIIRTPSDASLKTNVQPITYGLDTVMKLKPIKHEWVEEINMGAPSIGFIAQDMELEVPEVVSGEEYKSIDYPKLTAVLTKAIQEQQAIITQLQADVAALKGNS